MPKRKTIRTYKYQGRSIGTVMQEEDGKRTFEPSLTEYETLDLIENMEPQDRVHMRYRHYGVFRLLENYGHTPNDCIDTTDIVICAADCSARSLTELNRRDRRVWELVRQRGLAKMLFPELNDASESDLDGRDMEIPTLGRGGLEERKK